MGTTVKSVSWRHIESKDFNDLYSAFSFGHKSYSRIYIFCPEERCFLHRSNRNFHASTLGFWGSLSHGCVELVGRDYCRRYGLLAAQVVGSHNAPYGLQVLHNI